MDLAQRAETLRYKAEFPPLGRFDRFALDFETTGLGHKDYPVSASLSTPDGKDYYWAWGHPEGNNCSLSQFVKWGRAEFKDPSQTMVLFNGVYDLRMGRNIGLKVGNVVEDPGIGCALLNEFEPSYSLEYLAEKYTNSRKEDRELLDFCARTFGGRPTRDAQGKNYHKAPGHIVGRYGMSDSRATLDLETVISPMIIKEGMLSVYWLEQMLIPVLLKMYLAGVRVDIPKAKKVKAELLAEEHRVQRELDLIATWNRPINVGSSKDLTQLFDQLGLKYPLTKTVKKLRSRTTKKYNVGDEYLSGGNPSFKKEFLDSLDHPVGALIRNRRKLGHYANTFIQGYLLDNDDGSGIIHPNFHSVRSAFGGTITGRFSSAGGLNAQNVPARDDVYAPLIRGMFIPYTDDHQWLKSDYSQIEYRFFAHYAGGQLRQAYKDNPFIDFHDMVASMTGLSRRNAKNINFAKLYGAGAAKLALSMNCSIEEAYQFIEQYEARIPESKKAYNKAMGLGARRGYVMTWGGRKNKFRYGVETSRDGRQRKGYLGTHSALNKVLQGSSADLTKEAMVAVDQVIDWENQIMHLTVHDELDFSVEKGSAGVKSATMIREVMEEFELTVPIIAEAELGLDWGHCTKGSVPRLKAA